MKHSKNLMRLLGSVFLVAALSPWVAFAGDGVIEINQVKALAGGVTPGDAAGFPVTISQGGSYRLTSNLDVRVFGDVSGIVVTTDEVTIDMNGFWIVGATVARPGSTRTTSERCPADRQEPESESMALLPTSNRLPEFLCGMAASAE